MCQCALHWCPGQWANKIPVIFLSSLGSIQHVVLKDTSVMTRIQTHTPDVFNRRTFQSLACVLTLSVTYHSLVNINTCKRS